MSQAAIRRTPVVKRQTFIADYISLFSLGNTCDDIGVTSIMTLITQINLHIQVLRLFVSMSVH